MENERKRRWLKPLLTVFIIAFLISVGVFAYKYFTTEDTVEEKVEYNLTFDRSVSEKERKMIKDEISRLQISLDQNYVAKIVTSTTASNTDKILDIYVPVVGFGEVVQQVTAKQISEYEVVMSRETTTEIKDSINDLLGVSIEVGDPKKMDDGEIAFVPIDELDYFYKLLEFDGKYYLDEFDSGAVFRKLIIEGEDPSIFEEVEFGELRGDDSVFKVNITGVTALTRVMQRKLATVGDPLYFSELIGEFLSDADLTHVSNEVSFKEDCSYSSTLFCSPPEFIETLKASGVDLVELTGNHNNDLGSDLNTLTIELYESLGWKTVGGGLNKEDAAKSVTVEQEGSKITFLAYNFPDSPNGGAIAREETAGANPWDLEKIEADISKAKQNSDFVIVNVQYWECYAYPDGYVEYPLCDKPIGNQKSDFKKLVQLGADMVVGSSAHQPQTYEIYQNSPIFYGLGNLYFDQTSWPGTERGIVLTHYFYQGELLQTKLTPTVFDRNLQTRLMTDDEADYLLKRLKDAR